MSIVRTFLTKSSQAYAYTDVGSTIPGKESVESSLEHDSRDGGGRVAPGAATERPRATQNARAE